MSSVLRTDKRFQRVAVGLALENELNKGRDNHVLGELYENPDPQKIGGTYRRLIASRNHHEREAAFWLELGLVQEPTTFPDRLQLVNKMRRVETILYDILGKTGPDVGRPLNDWMNYVANAGESINDGYWLDAKILMSRAVDASEEALSRVGSRDYKTRHELDILRSETLRDFDELLKASFRLNLPEKRLDAIVSVQGLHLKVLRQQIDKEARSDKVLVRYLIERLSTAEKLLLQEDPEVPKARMEIEQAVNCLDQVLSGMGDSKTRRFSEEIRQELQTLLGKPLKDQ